MRRVSLFLILAAGIVSVLLLNGCKSEDDYKRERIEKASKQFQQAKKREIAEDATLTLEECLRLAREQNVARRVEEMERDASKNMMLAELFGMLPDLTVSNYFTTRNNQPGSRSQGVSDDGGTYGYSTSTDKTVNQLNIDLAFSLLDFGLAYFNTLQGSDRILAKTKQIERMEQNLELEVVKAYYQVAATQRSIGVVEYLMRKNGKYVELINDPVKVKELKLSPGEILRERERVINVRRRLDVFVRIHEEACITLRNLLGLYPSANVYVDDKVLDKSPVFDLPKVDPKNPRSGVDVELMEQIAVLHRPELYEIDIERHINILECRKTILMMLPNVQFYMDFINNNNSFLYTQSWWEMAVRAAYNALKTPQYIYRYMAYSAQADAEAMRAYSQAIAVMTQVRISHLDINMWEERYNQSEKEFIEYMKYEKELENGLGKDKAVRPQDVFFARFETALRELDKIGSLSSYYVAYYRLLNSLGVSKLDSRTIGNAKEELSAAEKKFSKDLEATRAEFAQRMATLEEARIAALLFEDGKKYYEKNDSVRAAVYFQRAAEKGNADAAFCLGKLYLNGIGVKQDQQEALKYLRQSASLGKKEAMHVCGWLYYRGMKSVPKDPEKSEEYYKAASENGDDRSFYWLGVVRHEKQDYAGALEAFLKAARSGDVGAMVWVGTYFWEGRGKERNYQKALYWFHRAAYQKSAISMYNLYTMYSCFAGMLTDILENFPEDYNAQDPESRRLVAGIRNLPDAIGSSMVRNDGLRMILEKQMMKVMSETAEIGPGKAERVEALAKVKQYLVNARKSAVDEAEMWKKEYEKLNKAQ